MDGHRFRAGVAWGTLATLAMSVVMVTATLLGVSPMPKPIPVALMARTLGGAAPVPALMALGIVAHFAYGGVFGGVLASFTGHVTVAKGLALGTALWLVMQVAWLPWLGWGLFGTGVTPMIAVATLALHLIYGATLGAVGDRHGPAHGAAAAGGARA